MLYLRGASDNLSHGISRRDVLRFSLGAGVGLPLLSGRGSLADSSGPSFGKAKSCILLYLFGGPSHIDTWDMKPEAPEGIRGEFSPIATNVPGIQITEHMPLLAQRMDHIAILRSLSHGDNAHGSASHSMLTGRRPRFLGEVPPNAEDSPHYGASLGKLRATAPGVLPFVSLPWTISTSTNLVPGQGGGFLGQACDPFRLEPIAEEGAFSVPCTDFPADVPANRLRQRQSLLGQLAMPIGDKAIGEMEKIYGRAFDALLSPDFKESYCLDREPPAVRERYGMNVFGQSVLLAARLVETGVPFITVYWPDRTEPEAFNNNGVIDKVAVAAWDTHGYHVGATPNFPMLKNKNLPPLDRALSALLDDLAARGLLDETLIVVTGEFGRSPRINGDAGRDHYGNVFSALLAGGGIAGGMTYGASDRIGAYPVDRPVSPGDFAATIYHCLGFAPHQEVLDRFGRPHRLADGLPILDILGG